MASSKPAVVLVHGAWHRPSHYSNVIAKLKSENYEVDAPASASAAQVAVPNVFAEDVAAVKKSICAFTDAGKDVVVVMHSYGGDYGSEAVAEVFEESKGQSSGGKGKIVHLFYISAFIMEKGTSVTDNRGDLNALHFEDGMLHHLEPFHRFYHMTPTGTALKAMSELVPQSAESFDTRTKYCGWADYGVPVTYLACEQDKAMAFDPHLLKFQKKIEDAGVKDFTRVNIDSDHTPWLSKPDEFFGTLFQVLSKAGGPK